MAETFLRQRVSGFRTDEAEGIADQLRIRTRAIQHRRREG